MELTIKQVEMIDEFVEYLDNNDEDWVSNYIEYPGDAYFQGDDTMEFIFRLFAVMEISRTDIYRRLDEIALLEKSYN